MRLPEKPQLRVPFYPDETRWYNQVGDVIVLWDLPPDVTQIETRLSQNAGTRPDEHTTELYTGKNFGPLKEGIWYARVRFLNNLGWGPFIYHKISLDTTAPRPFQIKIDSEASDNPTPIIGYETNDSLSGIKEYLIFVDGQELTHTASSTMALPAQPPGRHKVLARAVDQAGNTVEDDLDFEVLPIISPVITFVSKDIFLGEGGLEVKGAALPDISIVLVLRDKSGRAIYSTTISSDLAGNWDKKIDAPLKKGYYYIEARALDKRGALSLVIKSDQIHVRERPLLTLAGWEITSTWFFVILVMLLAGVFWLGWLSVRLENAQRGRRVLVAERDVNFTFSSIKKDVDKALEKYRDGKVEESEAGEIKFMLERINSTLEKTGKYLTDNIEEINQSELSNRHTFRYLKEQIGKIKNRFTNTKT